MATVEKTVKMALLNYPSIFNRPFDVYKHLFCCIGNGYEWDNGELVDIGELRNIKGNKKSSKKIDMSDLDERENKFNKESIENPRYSEINKFFIIEIESERANRIFTENNIDYLCKLDAMDIRTFSKGKDYSQNYADSYFSEVNVPYSLILNIPDNIKEDWLNAIEKFVNIWKSYFHWHDSQVYVNCKNKDLGPQEDDLPEFNKEQIKILKEVLNRINLIRQQNLKKVK